LFGILVYHHCSDVSGMTLDKITCEEVG
jgi:hypothetical protein